MNIEQRKAFMGWVKTHCDYEDLSAYELEIMQDAWLASTNRKGYKLVPVEPTYEMIENAIGYDGHIESIYKAMIGVVE